MTRHILERSLSRRDQPQAGALPSWATPLDNAALLEDAACLNGAAPLDGAAPTDNTAPLDNAARYQACRRHPSRRIDNATNIDGAARLDGTTCLDGAASINGVTPIMPPILAAPPTFILPPSLRKLHLLMVPPHLTTHPPPTMRPRGVASLRGSVFVREHLRQGASLSGSSKRCRQGVASFSGGGSPL